jgi:hypothetical protein
MLTAALSLASHLRLVATDRRAPLAARRRDQPPRIAPLQSVQAAYDLAGAPQCEGAPADQGGGKRRGSGMAALVTALPALESGGLARAGPSLPVCGALREIDFPNGRRRRREAALRHYG